MLLRPTQKTLMEKDGLVSMLRDPSNGNLESFEMVGKVVGIERPEVLLVREQVHNFRLVRIFGKRFEHRHDLLDGRTIADNVHTRENARDR